MSRSFGVTSFTTRSPIRTLPPLISSSPAAMRSAVVLPHPEGPTRTMNSPFTMVRSSPATARVPSGKTFETASKTTFATALLLYAAADESAHESSLGAQFSPPDERGADSGHVDQVDVEG